MVMVVVLVVLRGVDASCNLQTGFNVSTMPATGVAVVFTVWVPQWLYHSGVVLVLLSHAAHHQRHRTTEADAGVYCRV
jgi:hypothetical protein